MCISHPRVLGTTPELQIKGPLLWGAGGGAKRDPGGTFHVCERRAGLPIPPGSEHFPGVYSCFLRFLPDILRPCHDVNTFHVSQTHRMLPGIKSVAEKVCMPTA